MNPRAALVPWGGVLAGMGVLMQYLRGTGSAEDPWDGEQKSWSLWAGPLLFRHLPSATTLPLGLQDNHGPEPFRNVRCPLPGCKGE